MEVDDERLAGGEEARRQHQPWSAAMSGNHREKTISLELRPPSPRLRRSKKQGNVRRARWRDYAVVREFSRCRFMGQRHGHGNGGSFSTAMNGNERERTLAVAVASEFATLPPSLKLRRDKSARHVGAASKMATKPRSFFDRIFPTRWLSRDCRRTLFSCIFHPLFYSCGMAESPDDEVLGPFERTQHFGTWAMQGQWAVHDALGEGAKRDTRGAYAPQKWNDGQYCRSSDSVLTYET